MLALILDILDSLDTEEIWMIVLMCVLSCSCRFLNTTGEVELDIVAVTLP